MATIRRLGGALVALTGGILVGLVSAGPAPPPAGADAGNATVTIYGREGSFGSYDGGVPSGQRVGLRAVPGWGFPLGRQAHVTGLGGDGTVFLAGRDHSDQRRTADEMVIGAYEPRVNAYTMIRMRTTHGRDRATDPAGAPAAPSVADLETIAGGAAVAFTAGPTLAGQDIATDGVWPVFGIMTKVDGRWQVAGGAGWANQWTGAELRAASPGAGERACPAQPDTAGHSECRALGDMASLPQSRDIIVAQRDGVAALRVTGPGPDGRFAVAVTAHYVYPPVLDRGTAERNDHLPIAVLAVSADPTGVPGDERFAVMMSANPDPHVPRVVQEFSYDAGSGTIRPVSAPVLPGDGSRDGGALFGYIRALYDHAGNLWLARHNWLGGGKLAVFAVTDGRRRLGGPLCPFDPKRPLDGYRTTTVSGKSAWGQPCRPDYDIIQAKALLGATAIVEDPASHDIVVLTLGGLLMPVRAAGSGPDMTFQVGALVDTAPKLLPTGVESAWHLQLGVIDAEHRLWFPATHVPKQEVRGEAGQWLYAVAVGELFDPLPVEVPDTPGRSVTIQAEQTATTATVQRRGAWATKDVDSVAYRSPCIDAPVNVGCGYDGTAGNGFVVADDSGFGHLEGSLEYRIRVPTAGEYRLSYRVATFRETPAARIELTAGGLTYGTPVSTDGPWRTIREAETISLPAGMQTIRLRPPEGGSGWYLNSFTLQRT